MMGLDTMTATNCRKNTQGSLAVVARALIVLSASTLTFAFDVSSGEAQSTRYSRYVGRPNIIVDLSVLDKFGPAPTLAGLLRQGSANLVPGSAARVPGQLLAPPTPTPRSQLTLPKGVASRRPTAPPPKPQVSVAAVPRPTAPKLPEVPAVPKASSISKPAVEATAIAKPAPAVAAITAPKPIAIPVPAAPAIPPAVPKAVDTDIVTPSKTAIPQPPKVTAKVPTPPKATAAVPQAPAIPKAPSTTPASATAKTGGSVVAALTAPVDVSDDGNKLRILFGEESSNLPDETASELQKLAEKMNGDRRLRLVLYGFAGGAPDTPSKARRLSLFRALAVRTQLMNYGVRSTRMQLRALGNRVEEGPPDRVDIVVAN